MWTFRVAQTLTERVREVATPYLEDIVNEARQVDSFAENMRHDDNNNTMNKDNSQDATNWNVTSRPTETEPNYGDDAILNGHGSVRTNGGSSSQHDSNSHVNGGSQSAVQLFGGGGGGGGGDPFASSTADASDLFDHSAPSIPQSDEPTISDPENKAPPHSDLQASSIELDHSTSEPAVSFQETFVIPTSDTTPAADAAEFFNSSPSQPPPQKQPMYKFQQQQEQQAQQQSQQQLQQHEEGGGEQQQQQQQQQPRSSQQQLQMDHVKHSQQQQEEEHFPVIASANQAPPFRATSTLPPVPLFNSSDTHTAQLPIDNFPSSINSFVDVSQGRPQLESELELNSISATAEPIDEDIGTEEMYALKDFQRSDYLQDSDDILLTDQSTDADDEEIHQQQPDKGFVGKLGKQNGLILSGLSEVTIDDALETSESFTPDTPLDVRQEDTDISRGAAAKSAAAAVGRGFFNIIKASHLTKASDLFGNKSDSTSREQTEEHNTVSHGLENNIASQRRSGPRLGSSSIGGLGFANDADSMSESDDDEGFMTGPTTTQHAVTNGVINTHLPMPVVPASKPLSLESPEDLDLKRPNALSGAQNGTTNRSHAHVPVVKLNGSIPSSTTKSQECVTSAVPVSDLFDTGAQIDDAASLFDSGPVFAPDSVFLPADSSLVPVASIDPAAGGAGVDSDDSVASKFAMAQDDKHSCTDTKYDDTIQQETASAVFDTHAEGTPTIVPADSYEEVPHTAPQAPPQVESTAEQQPLTPTKASSSSSSSFSESTEADSPFSASYRGAVQHLHKLQQLSSDTEFSADGVDVDTADAVSENSTIHPQQQPELKSFFGRIAGAVDSVTRRNITRNVKFDPNLDQTGQNHTPHSDCVADGSINNQDDFNPALGESEQNGQNYAMLSSSVSHSEAVTGAAAQFELDHRVVDGIVQLQNVPQEDTEYAFARATIERIEILQRMAHDVEISLKQIATYSDDELIQLWARVKEVNQKQAVVLDTLESMSCCTPPPQATSVNDTQRYDEMQRERDLLQTMLAEAQADGSKYLADMQQERDELATLLADTQANVETLKQQVGNQDDHIVAARAEADSLREQMGNDRQNSDYTRDELADQLKAQVSDLTSRETHAIAELEKANQAAMQWQERSQHFERECGALYQQVSDMSATDVTNKSKATTTKDEVLRLTALVTQLSAHRDELSMQLENEQAARASEIDMHRHDVHAQREATTELEHAKLALEQELGESHVEVERLRVQVDEALRSAAVPNKPVESIVVDASAERIVALLEGIKKAEDFVVEEALKTFIEVEQESVNVKSEKEHVQGLLANAREELQHAKTRIDFLNTQETTLHAQRQSDQEAMLSARAAIEAIQNEVMQANEQADAAESKATGLEQVAEDHSNESRKWSSILHDELVVALKGVMDVHDVSGHIGAVSSDSVTCKAMSIASVKALEQVHAAVVASVRKQAVVGWATAQAAKKQCDAYAQTVAQLKAVCAEMQDFARSTAASSSATAVGNGSFEVSSNAFSSSDMILRAVELSNVCFQFLATQVGKEHTELMKFAANASGQLCGTLARKSDQMQTGDADGGENVVDHSTVLKTEFDLWRVQMRSVSLLDVTRHVGGTPTDDNYSIELRALLDNEKSRILGHDKNEAGVAAATGDALPLKDLDANSNSAKVAGTVEDRATAMAGFVQHCSGVVKKAKEESVCAINELRARQEAAVRFAIDLACVLVRVDFAAYVEHRHRVARQNSRSSSVGGSTTATATATTTADGKEGEETQLVAVKKEEEAADDDESDMCDVRLAASVVVTCIEHSLRRDCLEVVAKVLHFTEEEQRRVGLKSNETIWETLIPGWGRGEAKAQSSEVKDRPFSSLWSDFMMDETS